MGYTLAIKAYRWAQFVTPAQLNVLTYMALQASDHHARPSCWVSHENLAVDALGHPFPAGRERIRVAIRGLVDVGAVSYKRHGAAGKPPEYWLHLDATPGVNKRGETVDDLVQNLPARPLYVVGEGHENHGPKGHENHGPKGHENHGPKGHENHGPHIGDRTGWNKT